MLQLLLLDYIKVKVSKRYDMVD